MELHLRQRALFLKQYGQLEEQSFLREHRQQNIKFLLGATINFRISIFKLIKDNREYQLPIDLELHRYMQNIAPQDGNKTVIINILEVVMHYFLLELAQQDILIEREKQLAAELSTIPSINEIRIDIGQITLIQNSLYLSISLIELEIKKLLSLPIFRTAANINSLMEFIRSVAGSHRLSKVLCVKMMTVLVHLKIKSLRQGLKQDGDIIEQLLVLILFDKTQAIQLIESDPKIVVLYNCLKILLGMKKISSSLQNVLGRVEEMCGLAAKNTLEDHILQIFIAIKKMIFKKDDLVQFDEEDSIDGQDPLMSQRFSIFLNINLDEVVIGLHQVAKNVIRHRIASLATMIGFKLKVDKFSQHFLEIMHDSSFNNDIQTIKLCFELFESREYSKLPNLLQAVLATSAQKCLKEREMLIVMCGIFTGLHQKNLEEALLYAKLNLQQSKKLVLQEETLLQHVGFAYYNLASHQAYYENRRTFLVKALQYLEASFKINPVNYVASYCIANINMRLYDYDQAYHYAITACMSPRSEWIPFALLACVYYCQRQIGKAWALINELLNNQKYAHVKQLYYIAAYLSVTRLLCKVQNDQDVHSAGQISEQFQSSCRDRLLKTQDISSVVQFCQKYYQIGLNLPVTEYSDNFFSNTDHLEMPNFTNDNFRDGIGYRELESEKIILEIIGLFIELEQASICKGLIRILPESVTKNYYMAKLHEIKKEPNEAILAFKRVLLQQPYHVQSLVGLALVEENVANGLHYLDIAEKFIRNEQLFFARGMLLSKIGKTKEAHEMFGLQGEDAWMDIQPDLIYYY